jgi:peptidoglycan/LPS O-acetylase OafA/YrhL
MTRHNAAEKLETLVLVVILLVVGVFSGWASFSHVHAWTMAHTPEGRGDWFGWVNAVISELVPIAALLVMRRRRRAGQSLVYPAALLVAALALSITAQLAVAKPGFFGGLVSVVPALAFAALANQPPLNQRNRHRLLSHHGNRLRDMKRCRRSCGPSRCKRHSHMFRRRLRSSLWRILWR